MSNSSDDDMQSQGKGWPKKKPYAHKYCKQWEEEKEFKAWIAKSKRDVFHFHCKVCFSDYLGGKSAVRKHSISEKHQQNMRSTQISSKINSSSAFQPHTTFIKKMKESEIRISMYIVEHNVALRSSDHLISLFKSICPESDVIKQFSCNRTKATSIVCNVIGQFDFNNRVSKMKTQFFSIMIDESTDHSSIKHLAIVIRMFDFKKFTVRDEFAALLKVADGTAQGIHSVLLEFFNNNNIPFKKNMVGFASDGASVMFGVNRSVKTLLEIDSPGLFVIKCTCHSLALIASYACEKVPNKVEQLVRDVYTYLKYSFKRQSAFNEFQMFVEAKPHKLLQPCQTRWLSLHSCIKRVIEQYSALKLYFTGEKLIDNNADRIHLMLCDPMIEIYLHFLDYILPIITDLNIEFQSAKPKVYKLYSKIETMYKTVLSFFIKSEYLEITSVSQIQYRNPTNFLPLDDMYVGGYCMALLSKNLIPNKNEFLNICLSFYIECCHQLYKRFPFNSPHVQMLKNLSFVEPKNIKNIVTISPVAIHFKHKLPMDLNNLDRQWRLMQNTNLDYDMPMMDFWQCVKSIKILMTQKHFN